MRSVEAEAGHYVRLMLRETRGPIVTVAAACAVVAAAFLPWGRSGQRSRSSFELVDVAERAGLLPSPWAGLAPIWYLVPALVGLAVIALAVGRPTMSAVLGGVIGVMSITGSTLLFRSPLIPEIGAWTALVTGTVATAGALWSVLHHSKGAL